jgi:hypothetical protein
MLTCGVQDFINDLGPLLRLFVDDIDYLRFSRLQRSLPAVISGYWVCFVTIKRPTIISQA